MIKKQNFSVGIYVFLSTLVFSLSGCDQIASLKEYFSKPKKQQNEPTPQEPASVKAAPGNALAAIGNWSVTPEEFTERLQALKEVVPDIDVSDPQVKRALLEELVNQQLIVVDAEAQGLDKAKDVKAAIEEFRRTLIVREVARKLVENISASEDEAKEFYELNKEDIRDPDRYRVREIVVEDEVKAGELHAQLLGGSDFAELAKQNSKSESAASGGDMGFIENVKFPEMATQLLALEQGAVSAPFKGPEGTYIIKLDEKQVGQQIAFEAVKDAVISRLTAEKQQKMLLDFVQTLKAKYPVQINESLLE